MLLVINNRAINVSGVTFLPADEVSPDSVLISYGDRSEMLHGELARAVWERVQGLADAVITAKEEVWPPSSKS